MAFSKESKKRVLEQIEIGMRPLISHVGMQKSTREDHALMTRLRDMLPQFIEIAAHDHTREGSK